MRGTVRQALHLIGREHRSRWVLLVLVAIFASAFEMIGAILVFVLVGLVAEPSSRIVLPIVGDIQDLFGGTSDRARMLRLISVMTIFFLVRAAVHVVTAYVQKRVAHNAGARLSNRLVSGYLNWPYVSHLRRNSSDLIRNAHQAVQLLVTSVYVPMINVTAETVLTLGMLAVLTTIAPLATGIAVVVVGGAAAVLLLVVQPKLRTLGRVAHSMQRETLEALQESLHGIRDIKLLDREGYFAQRFASSRIKLAKAGYLQSTIREVPHTVIELSLICFILLFFALAMLDGSEAENTLPILGLFAYVGLRLQPSLQKIVTGLNEIRFSTAPVEDLNADLRAVERFERKAPEPAPLPFRKAIVLDEVSFQYEGAAVNSLEDVSLSIRPGEEIGICGPTGGGKTTLIDVLSGLIDPTSGTVTIDDIDLRGKAREWQATLGVVSQMVFLTDDTLRRNIALGMQDEDVDEGRVLEALDLAQLTEFVDGLPNGLNTTVGERGIRLSGGQRQRIAIARALYRRPSVLIFDEGTSALDNETEAQLMSALESLRGTLTVILVAHRLSTVQNSDRIFFVERGRIGGEGTFEALSASNQRFRALAGN